MTDATRSDFLYVTYIRTTPERLWAALTDPEMIRKYWFNMTVDCDWKVGAPWQLRFEDGRLADAGEVLETDPPRRLVLRWHNEWKPEFKAEGDSRCTFEIEPADGVVKLTVHHEIDRGGSVLIGAVSGGWPRILSNLKTLIETERLLFAA
jgi:uncharacterized protein YndB with AHSA1/START domain